MVAEVNDEDKPEVIATEAVAQELGINSAEMLRMWIHRAGDRRQAGGTDA